MQTLGKIFLVHPRTVQHPIEPLTSAASQSPTHFAFKWNIVICFLRYVCFPVLRPLFSIFYRVVFDSQFLEVQQRGLQLSFVTLFPSLYILFCISISWPWICKNNEMVMSHLHSMIFGFLGRGYNFKRKLLGVRVSVCRFVML